MKELDQYGKRTSHYGNGPWPAFSGVPLGANEQEMESVTDALASIAGRANLNFVVLKREGLLTALVKE